MLQGGEAREDTHPHEIVNRKGFPNGNDEDHIRGAHRLYTETGTEELDLGAPTKVGIGPRPYVDDATQEVPVIVKRIEG
jgi:hypothetical protein